MGDNVRLRAWFLAMMFLSPLALAQGSSPSAGPNAAPVGVPKGPDPIDDYIKGQMKRHRIPGLSLAVVRDGRLLKAEGYGLANVETNTPATPETRYKIASVSKPIVAAAVMLLVQDGKLSLDDKVGLYLEGIPKAWEGMTVRTLLNHTSGLDEDLPGFEPYKLKPDAEVVRSGYDRPLLFPPGEKMRYSNAAYFALGEVIRKASGRPWDEFIRDRLFTPAGMTSTRTTTTTEIVPQRARGYSSKSGSLKNAEDWVAVRPSGAFLSTVLDMAKWDALLDSDAILSKSSREQMWTPTKLKDGTDLPYGLGWSLSPWKGHKRVSHNGHLPGFLTQYQRFVDDRLTVIVMVNTERADTEKIAFNLAGFYIPELKPPVLAPIPDREPEVTSKVKTLVDGWVGGKVDLDLFAADLRKRVVESPPGDDLRWPGPIASVTLVERNSQGDRREYRYRVSYHDYSLLVVCQFDKANKITGFGTQLD
ncbi:serine hydrolase domain-containing protein [Singulisphaera rosea]